MKIIVTQQFHTAFTGVPGPADGENTQPSTTILRRKTEAHHVDKRVFHKQIHGQKVEKTVTFGDLNSFSASRRHFNEDYQFASNNCQDYQEQVRSELLGLPVHRSWRTAITRNAVRVVGSSQTCTNSSDRSERSFNAASGFLVNPSASDRSYGICLGSTSLHSAGFSSHTTSSQSNVFPSPLRNQALGLDDVLDGSLPFLFACEQEKKTPYPTNRRNLISPQTTIIFHIIQCILATSIICRSQSSRGSSILRIP
ncbi:hypothetical protein K491DRAFT_298453 [Lophiostoma macrostomum CBS 122681]|uniref:Uncharacterized protein n=1 Tax=Lophiostoma macrostomum CBS 122681 TaxID=1314788 RepID=A0A6A6SIA3_9PLEO|nr:hypothetical protein K491DRAFT_298453 [Lophiostoma macrostomum CBS 122681]